MARAHRSVLSTWVSRVCRPCPLGPPRRMNTPGTAHPSKRHRSPAELIRQWCGTFGPSSATYRRRPRPGDTWHRGEAFRPSNGPRHARWRAGDQGGKGLEALGPRRRDAEAAQQSFRQSPQGLSDVVRGSTARRASYGAARRAVLPRVDHRQPRDLTHRAEHPHRPARQRERTRRRCSAAGQARRFLATHGPSMAHSRPRRRPPRRHGYPRELSRRFQLWRAITGTSSAAEGTRAGPGAPSWP
jgi:putative transposase